MSEFNFPDEQDENNEIESTEVEIEIVDETPEEDRGRNEGG